eukprot:gene1484-54253_t
MGQRRRGQMRGVDTQGPGRAPWLGIVPVEQWEEQRLVLGTAACRSERGSPWRPHFASERPEVHHELVRSHTCSEGMSEWDPFVLPPSMSQLSLRHGAPLPLTPPPSSAGSRQSSVSSVPLCGPLQHATLRGAPLQQPPAPPAPAASDGVDADGPCPCAHNSWDN